MPKSKPKADDLPSQFARGLEAITETQRLAKAAVGYDNRDQSLALLKLLMHLDQQPNLTMYARNAVITSSAELLDEAAGLLVSAAARCRRAKSAAQTGGAE
ncbi:MAG TPA: hypothetical protein VGJ37_18500 [Pyrinomonadaceae bacterium]|jgi:hypothetical protein